MHGSQSIPQDPPSCIFIEYKKEVFLTAVGLAAIGALVIGILAVLSNVDVLNGVGAISQLGLAGGGALSGLGFFVLMLIGAYCVYRWWSQPSQERQPQLHNNQGSPPPPPHQTGGVPRIMQDPYSYPTPSVQTYYGLTPSNEGSPPPPPHRTGGVPRIMQDPYSYPTPSVQTYYGLTPSNEGLPSHLLHQAETSQAYSPPTASNLHSSPLDYRQATLRDLFANPTEYDTLDTVPDLCKGFPRPEHMTKAKMKGVLGELVGGFVGEFVSITLECITPANDLLSIVKEVQSDIQEAVKNGAHIHGVLTLFKTEDRETRDRFWVQATTNFFAIYPSFLRGFEGYKFVDLPSTILDKTPEEEKVQRERMGFSRLQELLKTGETTDCQGLRWRIPDPSYSMTS